MRNIKDIIRNLLLVIISLTIADPAILQDVGKWRPKPPNAATHACVSGKPCPNYGKPAKS